MYYYFGPLGRMMRMDIPERGFDNTLDELGAVHTALSGRHTKDVFGHKRAISIPLPGLTPDALSWFEACFLGVISGPFYFMDPRHRNRLSASTSGMAWPQARAWTPSSGTVTRVAASATLLTCVTPDGVRNAPAPSYAASWTAAVGATLLADPNVLIPVLVGENLVFSVYVVSGNPTLELVPYDAALVAQPAITGTITLAETPQRRYVPYTVPTGVVAVRARLRVAAGATVVTEAWQVGNPQAGGTPDTWVLGTGVPQVIYTELPESSDHLGGLVTSTLSLLEA